LENAAEAAQTPALVNEPIEVEPLAAHGIPADVEPEILSVEPSPPDAPTEAAPEPETDAPAVAGESNAAPPAAATAPDVATPPAN
jgi:hypothetical protein